MAAPIILFANTAGGTGKSISAHAMAVASAEYGKKVLLIDADPASTLTFLTGIENPRITVAELLSKSASPDIAIMKSAERFSLIPNASRAYGVEGSWSWVSDAAEGFDLVIIDSASGPSITLKNLVDIATLVIIPVLNSFLSIRGALHIRDFLSARSQSPAMSLLPTQCAELNSEITQLVGEDFSILEPAIRFGEEVRGSESSMRSVLTTSPHCESASDYREVTYSILESLSLL